LFLFFFFSCYSLPLLLLSFPTRRSSDLFYYGITCEFLLKNFNFKFFILFFQSPFNCLLCGGNYNDANKQLCKTYFILKMLLYYKVKTSCFQTLTFKYTKANYINILLILLLVTVYT